MTNNDYWIKDINLASEGQKLIDMAREDMPALTSLVKKYHNSKPLSGSRIAICVIPTPATGNLVWAAKQLGADVRLCSDNVVSVDDRVAAAIVSWGVPVFGKRDQSREEFYDCIVRATQFKDSKGKNLPPTQIIDDGADMTLLIHKENYSWLSEIKVVSEQTTCGVNFDKGLMRDNKLKVPVVDINTGLKAAFDNRYGPRESFIESVKACVAEKQLGGKLVLVIGYGMVNKGVVEALQAAGSRVVISEINSVRAAEAIMNGLEFVTIDEILPFVDMVVTATSTPHTLTVKQIQKMKRGAMLCNMGENQEYDAHELVNIKGVKKEFLNPNLVRYSNENWYVDNLCDGWLLNMRTGGNPPRVLGITFALQLMAHIKVNEGWKLKKGQIYHLPDEVDQEVAMLNFPEIPKKLTHLTEEQFRYMGC